MSGSSRTWILNRREFASAQWLRKLSFPYWKVKADAGLHNKQLVPFRCLSGANVSLGPSKLLCIDISFDKLVALISGRSAWIIITLSICRSAKRETVAWITALRPLTPSALSVKSPVLCFFASRAAKGSSEIIATSEMPGCFVKTEITANSTARVI